ncbi:hypothetical protein SLS64_007755 [Diaporthe eres]
MMWKESRVTALLGTGLFTLGYGRLTDYVDPLIGTAGPNLLSNIASGNVFPGPCLPNGMAKPGIDTSYLGLADGTQTDHNGGYSPIGNFTAVSMMHVSGTGGDPTSSVGYFTTTLLNDVKIEIAASNHTSLVRYTFPTQGQNQTFSLPSTPDISQAQTDNDAHVLVDLTHVLPAYQPGTQTYSQSYIQGEIHIRSGPSGPSYYGKASYAGGWPNIGLYDIHFCGNFTVPPSLVPSSEYVRAVGTNRVDGAGTLFWQYNLFEPPTEAPEVRSYVDAYTQIGNKMGLGALFSWTPSPTAPNNGSGAVIESKVGISHISAEQACSYIASEIPESTTFDDLVEQARSEWESKILSTVEVVEGDSPEAQNDTLKRMLYTALYHTAVLPTDKTGEIPLWTSNDSFPYFDDHYEMHATVLPDRNADSVTSDGATKDGRGALEDYLSLNYITRNHSRSISRGLEYSQNDFSIWAIAKGLAKSDSEQNELLERSSWWQNQWHIDANKTLEDVGNFTGFPAPRNADGTWNTTDYDPSQCIPSCGWNDDIYEATVWETGFSAAPHDMSKVIESMGGDDAFIRRLDASFLPGLGADRGENNNAGTAIYNPGNEPSFLIPFLYNYVPGYHWKTANQTRAIVDEFYNDRRNGYPGNTDAGAIPSWLVFNLIGFYPVVGQPLYLLGAPRFPELRVTLLSGTPFENVLTVRADNLSASSYYPQSVTLDGNPLDRAWLSHVELTTASELVFQMSSEPAQWDTGTRPWSLSGWE